MPVMKKKGGAKVTALIRTDTEDMSVCSVELKNLALTDKAKLIALIRSPFGYHATIVQNRRGGITINFAEDADPEAVKEYKRLEKENSRRIA